MSPFSVKVKEATEREPACTEGEITLWFMDTGTDPERLSLSRTQVTPK